MHYKNITTTTNIHRSYMENICNSSNGIIAIVLYRDIVKVKKNQNTAASTKKIKFIMHHEMNELLLIRDVLVVASQITFLLYVCKDYDEKDGEWFSTATRYE